MCGGLVAEKALGVHFGENSGLVAKLSQQCGSNFLCFLGDMVSDGMIHALPVSPHGDEAETSVLPPLVMRPKHFSLAYSTLFTSVLIHWVHV